ncbi:ATP-dependent Clp protease ATP-binding subunit CLPT1, chloroplastic isoform X1 [Cryptomeria japonica]|uniref:ATP-dependent Clp protease ATP-binding subunit CLPT1, chloroplastic isoform X1 n=1 Tax=Cryptomeria japonica TaxID=3369 RepID=UPI0025AD7FD4|nr:ATP-dependent Clp protease ATP-binding subunit CLPT1, chloroplastic isoform X1 [Cryptomeria japonica]
MAAAQMSFVSSSLSFPSQQRPSLPTFCRGKLSSKSNSSIAIVTSSTYRARKARYVSQRPLTILMNLPTANPEWAANGKIPKWSESSIRSFCLGESVARKVRYPSLGTEALLMGILMEGTSPTVKFLRANGFTLSKVREEMISLIGLPSIWDTKVEAEIPVSEDAQKALDLAVEEKIKLGQSDEVTSSHMLLGIWAQKGCTGQQILANLGFDEQKAKELSQINEMVRTK